MKSFIGKYWKFGVENCYLLIYYKSDNDSFSGVFWYFYFQSCHAQLHDFLLPSHTPLLSLQTFPMLANKLATSYCAIDLKRKTIKICFVMLCCSCLLGSITTEKKAVKFSSIVWIKIETSQKLCSPSDAPLVTILVFFFLVFWVVVLFKETFWLIAQLPSYWYGSHRKKKKIGFRKGKNQQKKIFHSMWYCHSVPLHKNLFVREKEKHEINESIHTLLKKEKKIPRFSFRVSN